MWAAAVEPGFQPKQFDSRVAHQSVGGRSLIWKQTDVGFEFLYYPLGFPGGASGEESTCHWRRGKRLGCDPWVGKIPWSGKCNPLQCSYLGNSMDRSLVGYSPRSCKELDTSEPVSICAHPSPYPHCLRWGKFTVLNLSDGICEKREKYVNRTQSSGLFCGLNILFIKCAASLDISGYYYCCFPFL